MSGEGATQVQKFYRHANVFLTGGSGFLGKLAMEKILRSCPDVGKVYVLIRPKKGMSVEERKKAILETVVFDRMKSEQPDSVDKIVFVSGDCSEPRLGLSDSDYHDLTQHVNIVLHLAATVRFDEKLKVAFNINTKGVMEVIELCHRCVSLKAAVFVTTTYSNLPHEVIKENFYDPPVIQLEEVQALMDRFSDKDLEIFSPKITGTKRIPYLFSKAEAERLILTYAKNLPVSIVRPSMVVSTWKDPLPGWLDNMYGPIAIVVGICSGVLRIHNTHKDLIVDLVPADMVVNCIIAAALTATSRSTDFIPIYNVSTSHKNPLTIRNIEDGLKSIGHEYPLKNTLWYPYLVSVSNFKLYTMLALFMHVLPGCIVDMALRLKGQPPLLMNIYRKIRKYAIITNMFTTNDHIFVNDNTTAYYETLEPKDKELFFFDTRQINWEKSLQLVAIESRKYLLNETLDGMEETKRRFRKLYILHLVTKYLFVGFAIWAIWRVLITFTAGIF